MAKKINVKAEHNNQGWVFTFSEPGFFSFQSSNNIQPNDLVKENSIHESIRIIRELLNEPGVSETNQGIFVPDNIIANADISATQLTAIGLPPLCPFRIKLTCDKPIADQNAKIKLTWLGANYSIPAVTRSGTLLSTGGKRFLLRNPLVSMIDAVDLVNSSLTVDERIRCFSNLCQVISSISDQIIIPDNFKDMVIYQATALGIQTSSNEDGYTFRPELLGDIPSDNDDEAPKRVSLLNRIEKVRFEKRIGEAQLLGNVEARPCYVLGRNTYVVLDVGVQAALKVVLEISKSDRNTRREFFDDKMAFFMPELEKVGADGSVIEFSDRVLGVELWDRGGVLGGSDSDSQWFPNSDATTFTFRDASGASIVLPNDDIDATIDAIRKAYDAGQKHIKINGNDIEIDESVIENLERIAILKSPEKSQKDSTSSPERTQYFYVKPKDNLKELSYVQTTLAHRNLELTNTLGLINKPQEHQNQGIHWLQQSYMSGMRGVLMADDMGLGKTFQILAFLRWLKLVRKNPTSILVVAPKTLLGNWLDEVSLHLSGDGLGQPALLFGKHLRDYKLSEGKDIKLAKEVLDVNKIKSADWVLTTYETLRDYQISLARVRFDVIVFDEAQKIKETGAMVTEAARSQNAASLRILMTGTPVENSLMDLWTLFDVAWPGRLGYSGYEFQKEFIKNKDADLSLIRKLLSEPTMRDGEVIPPLMLRRMKEDVSDLPQKHIIVMPTVMPQEQADAYSRIVQARESQRLNMLSALQAARNICLHPDLQAEINYADNNSINQFIGRSARLITTFQILDKIYKQNEKVLIFVDLRRAQSVLAEIIKTRYQLDYPPYVINGETNIEKRDQIRRGFQKRRGIFEALLLGPKSAGFGLTLHAANHVVHLNRWWNPAVEDQCTDRAYRIGQDKEVFVYLPIAKHPDPSIVNDSYDLVLDEMLKRKRRTSSDVISTVQFDNSDVSNFYGRVFREHDDSAYFDNMDWKRFEDYVINQLIDAGFMTNKTPHSGDAGADALGILGNDPQKSVVVQVKHRSKGKLGIVSQQEVLQVLQARESYKYNHATPFLVTNGTVDAKGYSAAKWHGIKIIDHSNLRSLTKEFSSLYA